ncbi:MAG: DUF1552 domain-containing protein [Polyangiaceae bacterium]|nr:DUF1552 domain-containing protein [Polyangiaceae bacterium]
MTRFRLSRRAVMRGMGSIAVALPWLEAMGVEPAQAQAVLPANRFLTVFTPGGALQAPQNGSQRYWPTGTETAPALSPILAPLAPVQERLLTIRGLNLACALGEQHGAGMNGLLTGAELENTPNEHSVLPSIDQVIATRISKGKKARTSLQFAIRWATGESAGRLDYMNCLNFEDAAGAAQIPPSVDPVAIYNDLFGQLAPTPGTTPGQPDQRILRKKSILDFVDRKFVALGARLGTADRAKLEQHLEKIREVEQGLSATAATGGKCQPPTRVDTTGYNPSVTVAKDVATDSLIPVVGKYMMDMMVMAFACDITAVGTLQWTDAEAKHTFPWLGLSEHHHFYQHDGGYRPAELEKIGTWYSEQHAYLLGEMAKVDMGGHSLLDESVVFFGSELGWPESHAKDNLPLMLAGSGGGLKTGRHLDFRSNKSNDEDPGIPHNNLLVAILNLFGDPRTTYQEPGRDYCSSPISTLV